MKNRITLLILIPIIAGISYIGHQNEPAQPPKALGAAPLPTVPTIYKPKAKNQKVAATPVVQSMQKSKVDYKKITHIPKSVSKLEKLKKKNLAKKWVSELSGKRTHLGTERFKMTDHECLKTRCPDRGDDVALIGVVVDSDMKVKGDLEQGNSQTTPALYIK